MSRPFSSSQQSIEIIYSDDAIVIVNKPTLLLSVPGRGPEKQDCLISRLSMQFPSILTVHRLDWETSGLMVFALNKDIQRHLNRQFQDRQIEKSYIAIVYGIPKKNTGEINLALRCDWENRPKQIVDPIKGKPSQTFWQRIELNTKNYSYSNNKTICRLELKPTTGRSHQLRVHLQAIGYPILGDPLYASGEALQLSSQLLLHASQLRLTHPVSEKKINFQSPAPF